MFELSSVKERRSPFQLSDTFFSFKTLSKHLNTAHSYLSIKANSSLKQRVEFQELSKLPPPLAAHTTFQFLHDRFSAIDAEILGAKSRKRKLKCSSFDLLESCKGNRSDRRKPRSAVQESMDQGIGKDCGSGARCRCHIPRYLSLKIYHLLRCAMITDHNQRSCSERT